MFRINEVYLKLSENKITREEASREIIELIFKLPFIFGLQKLDEDELMDFILFEMDRIDSVFTSFNKDLCSFSSYLYKNVTFNYMTWKRNYKKNRNSDYFLEDNLISDYEEMEDLYDKSETQVIYELPEDEKLLEITSFTKKFKNLKTDAKGKNISFAKVEQLKTIQREGTLYSALKNCNTIDDDMISKISIITEIEEDKLKIIIKKLREITAEKCLKQKLAIERRNVNYYYKSRCQKELAQISKDSLRWFELQEKLNSYTRRLERQNKKLKENPYAICPSNRLIAEVLKINERHVQYVLKKYEENMDTISMKRYYDEHEDLSGNW